MDGAGDGADAAAAGRVRDAPPTAELEDLYANAADQNPFFAPMLIEPALARLATTNAFCAGIRSAQGRLIGFAPFIALRGYARLPVAYAATWMHDHCFYGAPLVRRGCEYEAFAGLFAIADRRGAFIRLQGLDPDGAAFAAAMHAARQSGRLTAISNVQRRAALAGPFDAEAYLAQALPAKKRKELRRQRKRMDERGDTVFEILAPDGDVAAWTEQFLTLESAGWKGRAGTALGADARAASFLRESLARAHAAGALQFCRLTCAGANVAMIINFFAHGCGYSFKTAYDESYSRFSPGVQLELELIARLAADDAFRSIDSCAQPDHPMIDSLWRGRRTIVSLNISRRDAASRALFRAIAALEAGAARARAAARIGEAR